MDTANIVTWKLKSLNSILSLKIFLIEDKSKPPIGCLTFTFSQKYLWWKGLKVFLFSLEVVCLIQWKGGVVHNFHYWGTE